MMSAPKNSYRAAVLARLSSAFTLIELMVTVVLLSVIIIGLVVMFNQTQRAFTSSFTQVDILESGRAVAGLISREMEQMAPTGLSNNPAMSYMTANFYVNSRQLIQGWPMLVQAMVDPNDSATNLLQDVYFVTRDYQHFGAVGYCVFLPDRGVGSLYRYCNTATITNTGLLTYSNATQNGYFNIFMTNLPTKDPPNFSVPPSSPSANNLYQFAFTKLIDGVVDFRVRPYQANGQLWSYTNSNAHTLIVSNQYTDGVPDARFAQFTSNSLPAYLEVEIGILEDRTLARYNTLTNSGYAPGTAAWNYLSNHLGQVHVFRQRVAIRNAIPAPVAYQ